MPKYKAKISAESWLPVVRPVGAAEAAPTRITPHFAKMNEPPAYTGGRFS